LLDIETAPNTAHIWGLFKQNISINQIMESSYVLCWSAKWYGKDEIMFSSVHKSRPKAMLNNIYLLLAEADAVIHYNGTKFDIPTLNKEFLLYGMTPPAPYKQIDLLRVAKNQFRFPSNKLDYVAQALGLGKKTKHIGHELWIQCTINLSRGLKIMSIMAYMKTGYVVQIVHQLTINVAGMLILLLKNINVIVAKIVAHGLRQAQ
jgi:DNA polymerase elongation subunit (family B)